MPRRVRETRIPTARNVAGSSSRGPVLLLDTNVVLDVVLARTPWDADAALLLDAVAQGRATGVVAGHAITTIQYIVQRAKGRATAITAVSDLLRLLNVVALDRADFQRAIALGLADYEDAVQVAACLQIGAELLVTRNPKDYKDAPVVTRPPGEVLALLAISHR